MIMTSVIVLYGGLAVAMLRYARDLCQVMAHRAPRRIQRQQGLTRARMTVTVQVRTVVIVRDPRSMVIMLAGRPDDARTVTVTPAGRPRRQS